jgi:hypothetical protein
LHFKASAKVSIFLETAKGAQQKK